jgi:hypothetical protein
VGRDVRRRATEVCNVQDRISERVAEAFGIHLSTEERQLIAKRYTNDPEAFDLYARGRYFWNKRNASTGPKAIELFERAMTKDPNYEVAYSGLGDSYAFRSNRRPRLVCRSGSVARRRPRAPESSLRSRDADGSINGWVTISVV